MLLRFEHQAGAHVVGLEWLLNVDLGTRVGGDQVGQASGEREMTLIDAASTLAYYAVELMGIDGAGANSLGCTDVWARG